MSETTEYQLEAVPPGARRSGDTRSRWAWVEPLVWTERMLTALEQGVQGGVWYSPRDNHPRWPNAFFADQGLYSLKRAQE